MPLFIHDDQVDALAVKLQKLTNAPSKTAAVRRALINEIEREQKAVPLSERLERIRARVDAMGPTDPNFDMKAFSDELSGDI